MLELQVSQKITVAVLFQLDSLLCVSMHVKFSSPDSSDFVELTSANQFLIEFSNHKRRQCFNVTIINDNTDENDETFTVVLAKPSNERHPHIRIHPGTITITITDDDNGK